MKKILDYPNGPVFLEGRWKDIKFKAWRGTRSKDICSSDIRGSKASGWGPAGRGKGFMSEELIRR